MTGNWRDRAACRQMDPEIFFPIGNGGPAARAATKLAKAACRSCPVIRQCGDWAIRHGIPDGIWGGLDKDERRRVIRKRARNQPRP